MVGRRNQEGYEVSLLLPPRGQGTCFWEVKIGMLDRTMRRSRCFLTHFQANIEVNRHTNRLRDNKGEYIFVAKYIGKIATA